jgi:hypothetical protein
MSTPPPPTSGSPLTSAAIDALLLDTTPWLSCDECFERMDTYVEALLQDASHDDPAMAAHLRGCPACAEEADTLVDLVTAQGA